MAISVAREEPEIGPHSRAEDLRLWEDPAFASHIGGSWWLVARRGDQTCGTWMVPIDNGLKGPFARRTVRALPYAAPRISERHPKRRREILIAFIRYLQANCVGFELPLAPGFYDYGAFAELGAFAEARQTHCIRPPGLSVGDLTQKARNTIRSAAAKTSVTFSRDMDEFDFDAAIIDPDPKRIDIRKALARACASRRQIMIASAVEQDRTVGQVLALLDRHNALMMHAWRKREHEVRGVPSLLIARLAERIFSETDTQILDLEGSILATVDHFMDGIGAEPTPYAIVYWHRQRQGLLNMLANSLDIPGRTGAISV